MSGKKAIGVLCCLLGLTVSLAAQDWPQWRGPNRDGKVSGFKAPKSWPQELTKKWQITVGAGDATPALVGERLYVFARQGDEEVVLCLLAADGSEIWRASYSAPAVTGGAASHPGPRGTPLVVNGKVVVLGVGGVLSCYDAEAGKLLWKIDEHAGKVPDFFPAMSPLENRGIVYAHLGGKEGGMLYAVDLQSGSVKWKLQTDGPTYSSPILVKIAGVEQLLLYTDKSLIGVDVKNPRILWQLPLQLERFYTNSVSPVVIGDQIVVTGQGKGTTVFKFAERGDKFSLTEVWHAERGNTFNTPVVRNGVLWNLSDRGLFYGLEIKSGKELWAGEEKFDRFGAFVDAGEVIFMAPSNGGQLIVLQPQETGYREVVRYKVSDKAVYAHPVISGNRIFIKDDPMLTLWVIE